MSQSIIKFATLILLFSFNLLGQAQYVSEIIDYKPAPGQFTNDGAFGSPYAAQSIIGGTSGLVSLGAFGGHIIVKMEESVENHPNNPFGIDFTIFTNALPDWSEAAMVEVMKDENNNGLADDQWYLLAGSDYYLNQSQMDYAVTYFNPNENSATDVLWVDSNQDSGYVYKNSFHQQSYYPSPILFPSINQELYTLQGMKVEGDIDLSTPSMIKSYERYFGFADNRTRGSQPYDIPDNPYTSDLENSGGDAMDISWARDENGNRVALDHIDFIKITNAMNTSVGGLGEASTEISGIIDVSPNSTITGEINLLALSDMPKTITINRSLQAEAIHFISGIPAASQNIIWNSSNTNIATVDANGLIQTHQAGLTIITAKVQNQEYISNSFEILVSEPSSIEIILESQSIHSQSQIEINAIIKDQNNEAILGLETLWHAKNPELLEIFERNNETYIKGLEEGNTYIYAQAEGFPQIIDSLAIQILAESHSKKVYITIQTDDHNILSRQAVNIDHFDLNPYVDNAAQDYGIGSVENISLAHAIASIFESTGLGEDFKFKDDEIVDGALYLWKVPEEEHSSLNYYYGYGGNHSDDSKSRTWIIKLNDDHFARNMHQIEIQDEDEILIYHVPDSREEWTINQITLSTYTSKPDELITTHFMEERCQFYESGIVELLERKPIANALLSLNEESLVNDGQQVSTNSDGEAEFSINILGQHLISIGAHKAQIIISDATGIEELNPLHFTIYPNPFEDLIHIESSENNDIDLLKIYNHQGQLVKEVKEAKRVNLGELKSGVYLIQVYSKGNSFSKTIIKR
ncbi:T9SS type A sorting domain-containing protein [Lentimicrobium sp. S6]|uniref:T9SS type A sorting domain-containing protein n=1 Tax=Lentimicrobium sp. S6 TaxID=2735872 RepID=UPI0015519D20|nr:T9SS type A sorting domain-containing protein [Lentimicrobium sp. S6]NPD44137.1 T9SS type A sorting domain-containing protein [Lentimicrobium sp. S6]